MDKLVSSKSPENLRMAKKLSNNSRYIWNFNSKNNFKIQTCLFIIARFSASESLRVYINILKIPPPFASSDGYPASGIRYESVARDFSKPLPHIITINKQIRGEERGTYE